MKVLVWIEVFGGEIVPAGLEALGAARQFGEPVMAAVFGHGLGDVPALLLRYGVDEVFAIDHPTLADFRVEPYAALLASLARERGARVVLAGATTYGRDVLGCAVFELDAALFSDVTGFVLIPGGKLKATRPIYAGKLTSTELVDLDETVAFVTLRARAFAAPKPGASAGSVVHVSPALAEEDISTKQVAFESGTGRASLTGARVVVTGGRGVGGPEGFELLRALAEELDGAVGASRLAVDAGWIPYEHQVGQTGKVVSPDLYIACGISGAIQHQAGMRTSKVIVAINEDPNAPIFELARYGIVRDLFDVVPALIAALRAKSD